MIVSIILFIVIFCVIVVAHEFGHFIIAKSNGIHVVEFFVGMGPTLVSFTKGDTKYSIKLLPLGGACVFEGEDGLNTKEGEVSEGAFPNAPVWARFATVLAGPVFNFLLAYLLAVILVANTGVLLPTVYYYFFNCEVNDYGCIKCIFSNGYIVHVISYLCISIHRDTLYLCSRLSF